MFLQRLELIKAKLEKPTRLREQAAKEWREIDDKTLIFQRPDKEVEALRKVTRQSLTDFFEVQTPLALQIDFIIHRLYPNLDARCYLMVLGAQLKTEG